MTLALYGKTRRRKSLLVLLALFAVLAATVSGAALRPGEEAKAADSGWLSPSANGSPHGSAEFNNPSNAYSQNDQFADEIADNDDQSYGSFAIPSLTGKVISGIEVRVDAWSRSSGSTCEVLFRAWNQTSNDWTARKTLSLTANSDTDAYLSVGGTSDLWGESWSPSDFTDTNFAVELRFNDPGSSCSSGSSDTGMALDHIQVRVSYTDPLPADVTVTKAASASPVNQGTAFNWTVTIAAANSNATWAAGATVLTDQLPTTGATYGSPTDNAGNALTCSIDNGTQVLTCTAGGSGLTINSGSSAVVTIPVTPTATGTLQNPKSGGTCSVAAATGEINTGNNSCNTSTVTVNAASDSDLCAGGNLNSCIALLHNHNGQQTNPANSCAGIDANFVIDRSASIDSSELSALKGGITSFASALAGGSKFSGTQFSTTAEGITSGYVSAATFNTAVNGIATQLYTWTEGGIQVGAANNANGTANPDMMFIVTDGSPNATDGSGTANTSLMLNWVNAANDAIDAANVARGSYVVRAVFAGDADPNIPLATTGDKQAFANAVLTRIGGGSFLQGAWSEIAANLLLRTCQ